jgi:Meckel syndrome type 1 protein
LAQRFIALERVASTIVSGQSGQQNRIAGNLLDASAAKDIPAQTTTSDPNTAINSAVPIPIASVPAPSHSVLSANSSAAIPTAAIASAQPSTAAIASAQPAPDLTGFVAGALRGPQVSGTRVAGDGRTVQLGSTPAISTGGDTGLGRILARAGLAAEARETPNAASAPNSVAVASAPAAGTSGKTLAAFVKSFEAALTGITASGPLEAPKTVGQQPAGSPAVVPAAADSSAAFVPTVAPFTINRAEPVAAPAVATPAPIDHSAIADQVLRGAFMRNVGESSEIRLRLVPDALGDVSVKLVVSDGVVTAHVVAETPEVRDALVAAQPQLTKSLADAGLKLTGFTVDVSGGGFAGFSGQQNDQSQNGGRSRRWANSADPKDAQDETRLEAIPSFGPSVAPRANPGDFNYLV